jgi:DNA polymerase-3 subunit beta
MRVFANAKELARIMKSACKIARPKMQLPVLSHVAVSFDGGLLTVTANDGKRTYSEWIEAEGEAGRCTIEADKLLKACGAIGDNMATLEPDSIKGGKSKLKLQSGAYANFPMPDFESGVEVGITGKELCEVAKALSYATPANSWRTQINGLHLGGDCAAATDSFVLAWRKIGYDAEPITIPTESARQLSGLSGRVIVSPSQLIVEGESSRFTTTLLGEKYPDWPRMIPKSHEAEVAVNAREFVEAMRAAQIGGEKAHFEIEDGEVVIWNDGARVSCPCASDKPLKVGFHLQYMIDSVLAVGRDDVTLKLNQVGPSVVGDEQLIMPVKF